MSRRVREPITLPPFKYLLEIPRSNLYDFRLTKLIRTGNLEKELREVIREWIQAEALALLADWFIEYGEELVTLAASRPEKTPEVKPDELPVAKPKRVEFWRDTEGRRVSSRRRAG